jgi:hypothetical protein
VAPSAPGLYYLKRLVLHCGVGLNIACSLAPFEPPASLRRTCPPLPGASWLKRSYVGRGGQQLHPDSHVPVIASGASWFGVLARVTVWFGWI